MSQEPSQPTAVVFGRSHRSFSFSHGQPLSVGFSICTGSAQASTLRGSHCLNTSIRVCYPFRLISQALSNNLWQILKDDSDERGHHASIDTCLWIIFYAWVYQPTCELRRMRQYVPFYVTIFPGWYINIHLSSVVHHRSAFPRTMIDWLLRLWIWLTRFSHRHNLKWWNGTNNHVFLEITDLPSVILFFDGSSQRVIYSPSS